MNQPRPWGTSHLSSAAKIITNLLISQCHWKGAHLVVRRLQVFLGVPKPINITYSKWKRNVISPLLQQGDRAEQLLQVLWFCGAREGFISLLEPWIPILRPQRDTQGSFRTAPFTSHLIYILRWLLRRANIISQLLYFLLLSVRSLIWPARKFVRSDKATTHLWKMLLKEHETNEKLGQTRW